MVDGKARLISDLFCDGLGACLGSCPEGAIEVVEREAEPYDDTPCGPPGRGGGECPGSRAMTLKPTGKPAQKPPTTEVQSSSNQSQLGHWPIQLHLLSPYAPFLKNADLAILADCTAYAYANTHEEFIQGKAVAIGCPKLDDVDAYVEKLASIMKIAKPKSIRIVRMEVPCCGGMVEIVKQAMKKADEIIPFQVQIISISGEKM